MMTKHQWRNEKGIRRYRNSSLTYYSLAAVSFTLLLVFSFKLGVDRDGIPYRGIRDVWHRTLHVDGPQALWHGLQPRVLWISIGGFVFFGAYEASRTVVGPFLS